MKQFKEWRAFNEITSPAIVDPIEPAPQDWEFYHTKIQGRAKQYLNWLVDEVSQKNLTLIKKGFIIQEIMDALGMTVPDVVRVVGHIKQSLAKKQAISSTQQQSTW